MSLIPLTADAAIGETVPSGTPPAILSSTGSGVKSECRLVLWALVAGMDVLVIERYGEYIRVAQRDRLARGRWQVKNRVSARRATTLFATPKKAAKTGTKSHIIGSRGPAAAL